MSARILSRLKGKTPALRMRCCSSFASKPVLPLDFNEAMPDFLSEPLYERRNALRDKLERKDMLERRLHLQIPEFYVGSILAVTLSDHYAQSRTTRFTGICIMRELQGLRHNFILRNTMNNIGVEIQYDLYNPLIIKIEVLKLEKRLDDHLLYLRDADPSHSTFAMDMQPVPHAIDQPVPLNDVVVQLRETPWTQRWEIHELKGVKNFWDDMTPWYKRKFFRTRQQPAPWAKYDLIKQYRTDVCREDQEVAYQTLLEFESRRAPVYRNARKPIFHVAGREPPALVDESASDT